MRALSVAIDGPAGAGKSTVAQIVARRLAYIYIDTGAMYRSVAWAALRRGYAIPSPEIGALAFALDIVLTSRAGKTFVKVDGEDATEAIRTPEVTRAVSQVAQIPAVREAMLIAQRRMAKDGGVVMDGRDIGTRVLPDADVKIFLTASIEERARRRALELSIKGFTADFEKIKEEIANRDRADSEREHDPLIQASDARLIDTTGMSIEEAASTIIAICKEKAQCFTA